MLNATAVLTCGLSVLLLVLSWAVIQQRRESGMSLGDGGVSALERKIRAQGNLAEYGPMFILLIAIAEIRVGTAFVLWALSATFLAARVLHGYGLSFSSHNPKFRSVGMVMTLIAFVGAIITNIVIVILSA